MTKPTKAPKAERSAAKIAFDLLTAEDDGRVCKDIPESACRDQPQNFLIHVISLSLTKAADGFINPKLVLSWILTAMGAPGFFVGLLVPVREAGALLPQLFIAGFLRSLPLRKYAWALGSFVQGACAAGIALAALLLRGFELGLAVVGLLALLAVARSVCSVSYKDVLGKTVGKSRRGTATGTASTVAAAVVILYALTISSGMFEKQYLVIVGLFMAAGFWLLSSVLFLSLTEEKGATEGGGNPFAVAKEHLGYVFSDGQLGLFILTRGLLIATALAPPFMVALQAQDVREGVAGLGWLLLASALASLCSSYVWGRLADVSSRKVLMLSGACAGVALLLTVLCARMDWLRETWQLPVLLFGLMVAYEGVRLGRSTHLVDMANPDKRAAYTALSNTVIGVLLLLGGVFSVVAKVYGEVTVLAWFCGMSVAACLSASRLREVQSED